MLHPGDAEENTDSVFKAEIEEPAGRCGVNAHQIGTCLADGRQIFGNLLLGTELISLGIRREGSVGHSLDEELLFPLKEKLGSDDDPLRHGKGVVVGLREHGYRLGDYAWCS